MTKQTSVKKSVTVEASRDVAFRVFTQRMSSWWPDAHHIGKAPLVAVVVEPRVGGRWFERCADGSECTWGRVLQWDAPNRVVLAWQLDATFAYDASFETEVEVRFVAEGETRTRVELEHRNLDRYGDKQVEMIAAFESKDGWEHGLSAFAASARSGAPAVSAKRAFLLKLIPPRASFATDMNDREQRVMTEHVAYWTNQVARGVAIAFGPVADANGGWGVGIVEVDDASQIQPITAEDPASRGEIGMRYEVLPMPRLIARS